MAALAKLVSLGIEVVYTSSAKEMIMALFLEYLIVFEGRRSIKGRKKIMRALLLKHYERDKKF
ncbi:MAG: hypothetical protein JRN53_04130 [Nitrososphaerota archaeon]|jgi:hypothetical protein|nr:hypothetical protein [Nitrososphaerota archaeon]MDG7046762.1 hypothetical protein [Nitrososphaerota archaeon]